MHGVTTVIVGFVFVCVIFPRLVRNRPQYYAAVTAVVVVILLDSLAHMTAEESRFRYFAYSMTGLLQICSIVLLIMSAGGLTMRELGDEFKHAYEVIRRGEEEKEVIIPIAGQRRGPKAQPRGREVAEEGPQRYTIDWPEGEESPETEQVREEGEDEGPVGERRE